MPELVYEYEVGTLAKLVVGDIEGIITAVVFRSEAYCMYQLTWVHDGEVNTGWFLASALTVSKEGEAEARGPKFKTGHWVKFRAQTSKPDRTGIVLGAYPTENEKYAYSVRIGGDDSALPVICVESELEAYEDRRALFKKGDRVSTGLGGQTGIVEDVYGPLNSGWRPRYDVRIESGGGEGRILRFVEHQLEAAEEKKEEVQSAPDS